jgi:hypothetical protein
MGSHLRLLVSIAALAMPAAQAARAAPPAVSALGTWKLNVAKSTFTPGPGWRSQTRTYTLEPGGGVLIRWDGVGARGEPMHVSFISRLDGKDYPMKGSDKYDTLNGVAVDAFTVKSEEKRGGSLGGSFHPSQPNERAGIAMRTISADGKVMTITDEGTDRKGEKFSQMLVFDRQ